MARYAVLVAPSANRVYSGDAARLMTAELAVLSGAYLDGTVSEPEPQTIGGLDYLVFAAPGLDERATRVVSNLSSVYAVFEVKQHLDKGHLEYAGAKAASVRRLRRTSVGFPTANGPAAPRKQPRILAGILALDSGWIPMVGGPLIKVLGARPAEEQIDLALALRAGAFEVTDPASPADVTPCEDPGVALIFFVLRLLKRLQDMATVGAMDLDEYTNRVWPLKSS